MRSARASEKRGERLPFNGVNTSPKRAAVTGVKVKKEKKNHIEFFIFSGKLFFSGDAPKKDVNDRLRV